MSRAYFITGTDTEIGKTFTAAALTHAFSELGRRVTPIKALAAGQELVGGRWVNEDVATLHAVQRLGLTESQVGRVPALGQRDAKAASAFHQRQVAQRGGGA